MEILLLIIAGVVLYMLYNSFSDYMKNPYKVPTQDIRDGLASEYKPQDNPYIQLTDEDRIKKTEFGILAQILALIAQSDGKVCALERELLNDLFDDMAKELNEYNDYKDALGSLQKIFDEAQGGSLDTLAESFVEATKGEYKKRVKVVEFLFALAYSDGVLDENEREKIIDVAAIFELNNDDFNKIYDDFERKYSQNLSITKENALKILGLEKDFIRSDLENAYHEKIKEKKQNIFKGLNKSFEVDNLREIDEAYKVLKQSLKSNESSLRGEAEAIQKNNVDCHDLPKANLAMTSNTDSIKSNATKDSSESK